MNHNFGLPDLPGVPNLGEELPRLPEEWFDEDDNYAFAGPDPTTIPVGKRAVIYLRVSSPGQTRTSYDALGQSIPTQRTACLGKADALGLVVLDQYVEPGKSALSIEKRPAFRRMLARIQAQRDVDVVIVYKFSRAARNQWEDAILGVALERLGVKLVSVTEPIDDTAAGKAMRGMIAVFNEFSSNSSGEDIRYKMAEKAKRGGTLGRAPLGYLNFIDRTEGREVRTVVVDEERAPYVKLAFELYATGEYTLADLADELTDRGLLTRATAKRPAGPVSTSKLQRMLKDRYYIGVVEFQGQDYPGQHPSLIDEDLFERVQEIIRSRGYAGERRRVHHHFLKGTVYCAECKRKRGIDQRLLMQHTVGRNGGQYDYFFCPGRKDGTCSQPFHDIGRVEEAVERHYKHRHITDEFIELVRQAMDDAVSDQEAAQRLLKAQLDEQIDRLDVQEENLLDLAADGTIDQGKIKARLFKIQRERKRLVEQSQNVDLQLAAGQRVVEEHLTLLRRAYRLYMSAGEENKRRLNQLLYQAIYLEEADTIDVTGVEVNEPYDALYAGQAALDAIGRANPAEAATAAYERAYAANHADKEGGPVRLDRPSATAGSWASCFTALLQGGVSTKPHMVELKGLEPSTPCIAATRRACSAKFEPTRAVSDHLCSDLGRYRDPLGTPPQQYRLVSTGLEPSRDRFLSTLCPLRSGSRAPRPRRLRPTPKSGAPTGLGLASSRAGASRGRPPRWSTRRGRSTQLDRRTWPREPDPLLRTPDLR